MAEIRDTKTFMRVVHRYLGYFMAGIMAVYALSGILLIYRDTDFLKTDEVIEKTIAPGLNERTLQRELRMRRPDFKKEENGIIRFNNDGVYEVATGKVSYHVKELPYVLNKMTQLHKAVSKDKLSPLNVFFGVTLFFFVISSFWMFNLKSKIFQRGLIFTAVGLVLAVILVLIDKK